MSAEPVRHEDPHDPTVILRDLPERERAEFLRQYHTAVDNAHDPAGYRQLQHMLHVWSLAVIATNRPGYYDEIAAYVRPADFGDAGLVTYLTNDAALSVIILDVLLRVWHAARLPGTFQTFRTQPTGQITINQASTRQ